MLHLKICANLCKSICDIDDKIMGNWAAKILKALNNRKTAPNYVKVLLLLLEICANFCKSIYDDNYKIMVIVSNFTQDHGDHANITKGQYVHQEDYDFFHFGNNIPKNTDNLCNLNHTIRQL